MSQSNGKPREDVTLSSLTSLVFSAAEHPHESVERLRVPDSGQGSPPGPGQSWQRRQGRQSNTSGEGIAEAVSDLIAELKANPVEDWQAVFRLARRLKAIPGFDPDDHDDLIAHFGTSLGIDPTFAVLDFAARWEAVRFAEGTDPFVVAVGLAAKHPVPVAGVKAVLGSLASLAFHLSRLSAPGPFIFDTFRVGRFLFPTMPTETEQERVKLRVSGSRAVNWLVKAGVIAFENAAWSYKDGLARTFWFTGKLVEEDDIPR